VRLIASGAGVWAKAEDLAACSLGQFSHRCPGSLLHIDFERLSQNSRPKRYRSKSAAIPREELGSRTKGAHQSRRPCKPDSFEDLHCTLPEGCTKVNLDHLAALQERRRRSEPSLLRTPHSLVRFRCRCSGVVAAEAGQQPRPEEGCPGSKWT
jgi:hypothetical protein